MSRVEIEFENVQFLCKYKMKMWYKNGSYYACTKHEYKDCILFNCPYCDRKDEDSTK